MKKIEKLFEQAANKEFPNEVSSIHPDELKKFALLIVQKCAIIALKSGDITNKSEQAKAEAQRIYHKIQDHFGIEDE